MKYKLGEICKIVSGTTPKTSIAEYWDGDIKWLTPAEIKDDSYTIYDTVRKITLLGKEKSGLNLFPKGTVILSSRAPIGKVAIAGCDMCCNQGFKNLICSETVYNKYLYWFLKNKKDYLNSLGRGATFKELSKQIVSEIIINLPSYNEQEKIVDKLERLQKIVATRKHQLLQLDKLTKSLFIEMFGDPILNPRKWDIRKLNEITALITNGNTPKGGDKNYVDDGILFIRSQNVWKKQLILDDVAYIDTATHKSMKKSSVHNKDILITKTGRVNTENSSLGRAALFCGLDDSANINGHVYLVRLNGTIMPEYVVEVLTSDAYRKYIRKVCVGGIDKRQINLEQVEDFPIIIPPIENQRIFVFYIKNINKHKSVIQKSLDETQLLFDSLMQKYFG